METKQTEQTNQNGGSRSDTVSGSAWDEKYVDERLGRDASWPQIIEAANYSIRRAHEDGYRQGAIDGVLNERESRAAHGTSAVADASEPRKASPIGGV